jgi:hypothetical protein
MSYPVHLFFCRAICYRRPVDLGVLHVGGEVISQSVSTCQEFGNSYKNDGVTVALV